MQHIYYTSYIIFVYFGLCFSNYISCGYQKNDLVSPICKSTSPCYMSVRCMKMESQTFFKLYLFMNKY